MRVELQPVYLIDTNVIMGYLLDGHPELSMQAKQIMSEVTDGRRAIFILESVFTECVFILKKFYRIPRERITGLLIQVCRLKGVVNANKDIVMNAL